MDSDDSYNDEAYTPNSQISQKKKGRLMKKGKRVKKTRSSRMFLDEEASEGSSEEEDYGKHKPEVNNAEYDQAMEEYDRRKAARSQYTEQRFNDLERDAQLYEEHSEISEGSNEARSMTMSSKALEDDLKKQLLPGLPEPSLWSVKCVPGKEKLCTACVMNKFIAFQQEGRPLAIMSVVYTEKVEGIVFIEAFRENHIKEAIKGLRFFFKSRPKRVEKEEAHQLFKLDIANKPPLQPKKWVRIKSGPYTNDIARVAEVVDGKVGAYIKIIPRIIVDDDPHNMNRFKKYKKITQRQLFNPNTVHTGDIREEIHDGMRKRVYKWNKNYYRKGFLVKYYTYNNLEVNEPNPTYSDISVFQNAKETMKAMGDQFSSSDSDDYDADEKDKKRETDEVLLPNQLFLPNDKIVVVKGELANLHGVVDCVLDETVHFTPKIDEFEGLLEINYKQIMKFYSKGDLVRCVTGFYKGLQGTVLWQKGDVVRIYNKDEKREIEISPEKLQISNIITDTEYYQKHNPELESTLALYGMVMNKLTGGMCCVQGIESYSCNLIDESGRMINVDKKDLDVFDLKGRPGVDQMGIKIYKHDIVFVKIGNHRGKRGKVIFIDHSIAFIKIFDQNHINEVICEKIRYCVKYRAIQARRETLEDRHPERYQHYIADLRGENKIRSKRASYKGKRVTIYTGDYKGSQGTIRKEAEGIFHIEVHCASQILLMKRGDFSIHEEEVQEMLDKTPSLMALEENTNSSQEGFKMNSDSQSQEGFSDLGGSSIKTPSHTGESQSMMGEEYGMKTESKWSDNNLWAPASPTFDEEEIQTKEEK